MDKNLFDVIISAIEDKKGKNIVSIELSAIDGSIADAFVVCNADSTTQVAAIADGIEEEVEKQLGERPRRVEGLTNAVWVVIDYVDIMVHIFLSEARNFYRLEELWADAPASQHGSFN